MSNDKLSYDELRQRLEQAEAALAALRRGEVDLVIGTGEPLVVRFRSLVEENERLVQQWQATFDTVNSAIWVLDREQRILQTNRTAERFFGKPRQEMVGRHCWEIVHGTTEPIPECPMLRGKQSLTRESMELPIRDRWFQVTVDPILDGEGRYTGAVHILSDITERKQAEEEREKLQSQLLQAQRLESVGRLAGGVAHDFNNMLSVILGHAEIVHQELHPGDPLRNDVEQILKAVRSSAGLTRQLLAFGRKQTLQPEVLDLNEVVRNIEKMLRRLIGEDIALELALAGDLSCVKVDPGQIEQVIMNLAVNARDVMPTGGKLLIETSEVELDEAYAQNHAGVAPGKYVMLAMTDTGCGMDKEVLSQIFEPFFTTKEKGKGTGLGLSTAYGIVKQSGGNIWAYSEPGQGATFKIYLPVTGEQAEARAEEAAQEERAGGGEHILVVEDEEALRKLLKAMLSRLGYKVTLAANGGEALLLVEEKGLEPDLIMTDVVMPGISGKVLSERLRQKQPDLKALFMSGYTDNAIVHHGVLDPETPFIQKPFTLRDIAEKVLAVLRGRVPKRI
ncbi:MAG: response regulator [Deltaproteobacteria bacterium]|nr:response regulator [Deltaproteobacteria bacterium]